MRPAVATPQESPDHMLLTDLLKTQTFSKTGKEKSLLAGKMYNIIMDAI